MPELGDPQIIAKLREIRGLPALPATCQKILEFLGDGKSGAREVGRVIQSDPALTSRVLRLVNSPFYGFPRRITSVSNAIAVIGMDALRHIVVSFSVVKIFREVDRGHGAGARGFDLEKFWEHSLGCATVARALARKLKIGDTEAFFVAGLIHDLGKLVENFFFAEEFPAVFARVAGGAYFRDAEQAVYGFDHARLGRSLMELWRLPEAVVKMVALHHDPGADPAQLRPAAILHVADVLVNAAGIGDGGNRRVPPLDRAAWDSLGLAVADLDGVLDAAERDLADARQMLG